MPESKVFNQDCMEGMKQYPDKYFDLAIVDPPYGIDRNGMEMGNSVFNKDEKVWDKDVPTKEYFEELFRVSKNQVIWGGNYFELPVSRYFAIWDKGETMYARDFAECEFAWVRSGGTRIYKKILTSQIESIPLKNQNNFTNGYLLTMQTPMTKS